MDCGESHQVHLGLFPIEEYLFMDPQVGEFCLFIGLRMFTGQVVVDFSLGPLSLITEPPQRSLEWFYNLLVELRIDSPLSSSPATD